MTDAGAPRRDEVQRMTNAIVAELGECDLESALTVVCNLAGQLIAGQANGSPKSVEEHMKSVARNISKAAVAKMIHDDDQRRASDAPKY